MEKKIKHVDPEKVSLTPEDIERRHQVQFLEAYNSLVKEYGYTLQPVIQLQLVKIKHEDDKSDDTNHK